MTKLRIYIYIYIYKKRTKMCEIWTYVRKDRLKVSIEKEITDFFFLKM